MRVLYIHTTGIFGGSSRSLCEAIRALPKDTALDPVFLTKRGGVEAYFRELGDVVAVPGITQFDNTRWSYYRGVRWGIVLRELAYLPTTLRGLKEVQRKWGRIDVVHVNEITAIIAGWFAKRRFGAPLIVHVRAIQRTAENSLRTRWLNRFLNRHADAVIAIDENVKASMPHVSNVEVIHNTMKRHPAPPPTPEREREDRSATFRVGFVGNLIKPKGILELIEAARIAHQEKLDVEWIVVGDELPTRSGLLSRILKAVGLEQYVGDEVRARIRKYGLGDKVHIHPFRRDIAGVFTGFDAICFPSPLDAPGRPIFEAALSRVPSVVAVRNPKPDTLVDGVTGIAIPEPKPQLIYEAIARLANDRALTARMGDAAYERAVETFDPSANAEKLLTIYDRALGRGRSRSVELSAEGSRSTHGVDVANPKDGS